MTHFLYSFLLFSLLTTTAICTYGDVNFDRWKYVLNMHIKPKRVAKRQADEQFVLYGIRPKGEAVKVDGNRITVGLNTPTTLLLFGKNLEKTNVMITASDALKGTACNANEAENTVNVKKVKESIYELQILEDHLHIHEFCLQAEKNKWIHQGNDFWVSFEVLGAKFPLYVRITVIIFCLMISALFSGLSIGLMALDKNELKVLARCGNERDRKNAKAVQPLRENGNFLLCSLIIGNTVVNAALTVFLNDITTGILAVVISTLSIVIVGEIFPQALCSRYGLYIGAKTIYITYLVMIITSPASYPLSKFLDWMLGEEIGKFYDRECLEEYIKLTQSATRLEDDEINVIKGAFEFNRKTVAEAMTPLDQVYMIPMNEKLDAETIYQITKSNFSRIPVYSKERSNIVGILYVKDIMLYTSGGSTEGVPIETIVKSSENYLITVKADQRLKILLDQFKQGKCHMAIVKAKDSDKVIGVVTMEDVLEEVFQEEIIDETDIIIDPQKRLTRKGALKNISDYFKIGEARSATYFELSPQLLNAMHLFLSTCVKPFASKYMSDAILRKLLTQKIYHEIKVENGKFQGQSVESVPALYTNGVACDYFVLLVEGKMIASFGKEDKFFECKPFTYFGISALEMSDDELNKLKQNLAITGNPSKPFPRKDFVPDFTLKIMSDCLYMKITRTLYLTACRAYFTDQKSIDERPSSKTEARTLALKTDAKKSAKSAKAKASTRSVPKVVHK